jgi:hypothetical protein
MKIENLDSIMFIAIKGPTSNFDSILMDAIYYTQKALFVCKWSSLSIFAWNGPSCHHSFLVNVKVYIN